MAKFYGKVGYAETLETTPGIWKEVITEKDHYGDVLKLSRKLIGSGGLNDNVNINNEISILSDPFANQNFINIRYVIWSGVKWRVSSVTVNQPRLILSLGGVYNGDEGPAA